MAMASFSFLHDFIILDMFEYIIDQLAIHYLVSIRKPRPCESNDHIDNNPHRVRLYLQETSVNEYFNAHHSK
jgi:hypothetical protein